VQKPSGDDTGCSGGAMNINDVKGNVDFGIITVKEEEFLAVRGRFQPIHRLSGKFQKYRYNEEYRVAILRCLEQGPVMATTVTRNFIDDLQPRWLLLVGIAGGVPGNEFTLGDVMLASRLHDFSVSASVQGQGTELNVGGGRIHPDAAALLADIPGAEELEGWNTEDYIAMKKPVVEPAADLMDKSYYGNDEWQKKVLNSLMHHFPSDEPPRLPIYRVGPCASSGILVKDADLLQQWQDAARSISHVEMELSGVYEAAWQPHIPLVAIRGLSDVVGYKRSGAWTDYACHTAAAFAAALVRSGLVDLTSGETNARKPRWNPTTGDVLTDQVLTQLNAYDAQGKPNATALLRILKPFFTRTAFYHDLLIEHAPRFLFVLLWAERLVQTYQTQLESAASPPLLQEIASSIHRLAEKTAKYMGVEKILGDLIDQDMHSKQSFLVNAPRKRHFDADAMEWREKAMAPLRELLEAAGLISASAVKKNSPPS